MCGNGIGPPRAGLGRFRTGLALLVPEPENPYEPQDVAVHICGQRVGYLSRDDAQALQPLIVDLMSRTGKPVGCKAEIRGSTSDGVDLFFSRAMFVWPLTFAAIIPKKSIVDHIAAERLLLGTLPIKMFADVP